MSDRKMLTPKQAADFLGVRENLLAKWRCAGGGPRFAKFGRHIRYAFPDLLAWVAAKTVRSTSEPPGDLPEEDASKKKGSSKTKDARGGKPQASEEFP